MKIAYLVNQYPKVSHSFIRREIRAIEELGHSVARWSIRRTGDIHDREDEAEATVTETVLAGSPARWGTYLAREMFGTLLRRPWGLFCGMRAAWRLGRRSERGWLAHLVYLAEACRLLRRAREQGIEHLHAHFGTNPAAVALLVRVMGGPSFSFTVHGPEEFDKPQAIGLTTKIEQAAFTVAISSFGRSQLYRWCDREYWDRLQVVRCGLDVAMLDAGEPDPVPDVPRLVCVGRLCEQKGQLLLIDALAKLVERGVDVRLVFVGDGEMRPEVEARLNATALSGRCHITGWATGDEVREQLRGCRAMVLPSFAEGLPVVIMEAMAMGRPVISTAIAGIPELVKDGENGWLVPAGDGEALAEAMQAALETPVERLTEMGRAGRAAVVERHDIRKEVAKLAALFEASIAGAKG